MKLHGLRRVNINALEFLSFAVGPERDQDEFIDPSAQMQVNAKLIAAGLEGERNRLVFAFGIEFQVQSPTGAFESADHGDRRAQFIFLGDQKNRHAHFGKINALNALIGLLAPQEVGDPDGLLRSFFIGLDRRLRDGS